MTKINNDSLAVAALKDGTVIDRINPEVIFKVVDLLNIPNLKNSVTIGVNLDSKHMGKKASSRLPTCSSTRKPSTALRSLLLKPR